MMVDFDDTMNWKLDNGKNLGIALLPVYGHTYEARGADVRKNIMRIVATMTWAHYSH